MRVNNLLKAIEYALQHKCSDIHITENKPFVTRTKGLIEKIGSSIITIDKMDEFIKKYIPHKYNEFCRNAFDIDTSFEVFNRRFRASIFKSIDGIVLAIRILSDKIPQLEKLSLPPSVANFCEMETGLVLVVGTTGSGKTTTLAGIIDKINQTKAINILTIEDPIEYIYAERKARIVQREIGTHIESFALATRGAMRQDPNCVLIGELRDFETISNAVTIAETGHLVFATIHAKSAVDTIDRMLDVFTPEAQEQIRVQLASVLRGVIHQNLVPSLNGGQTPLVEILMIDDTLSGMIRQRQNPNAMRDYMRGQRSSGSVHLVDNVLWHIQNGEIELENLKNSIPIDDYNLIKSLVANTGKRGGSY